jgi:hypothetical protein
MSPRCEREGSFPLWAHVGGKLATISTTECLPPLKGSALFPPVSVRKEELDCSAEGKGSRLVAPCWCAPSPSIGPCPLPSAHHHHRPRRRIGLGVPRVLPRLGGGTIHGRSVGDALLPSSLPCSATGSRPIAAPRHRRSAAHHPSGRYGARQGVCHGRYTVVCAASDTSQDELLRRSRVPGRYGPR